VRELLLWLADFAAVGRLYDVMTYAWLGRRLVIDGRPALEARGPLNKAE